MRGGRRNLAVTGSFFLLLSSFLAVSHSLSPPSLSSLSLPLLGLRVGSDVTSAEIPPNSTAQWRAGGQPSPAARRAFKERAKRSGERGGERAGATRSESGQGGEAARPESREPEEKPRERKRGREPGRALRREQRSSRHKQSHCGKEDRRGGWGGGEEKGICAGPGALIIRGGGPGRPGDGNVLLGSKPGRRRRKGQGKWPKKWNKGQSACAWVCLGRGMWGVSMRVPVCDLFAGLQD